MRVFLMLLPSQAITMNSSSSDTSWTVTSGKAVTICCSGGRSALFLNSKSPMARDSARLPLTRPKSTNPPAAQILAFSPGCCQTCASAFTLKRMYVPSFCGLWSNDSGFARPLTPKTVLESPALPCITQYLVLLSLKPLDIPRRSCPLCISRQWPYNPKLPPRIVDLLHSRISQSHGIAGLQYVRIPLRMDLSIAKKPSFRACSNSPFLNASCLATIS